jgi:predicted PhzF superfamily epimerase YddE/YHI9
MRYAFEPMRTLMLEHDLTTLQLIWRESPTRFRARDPFAAGGVVEDPATGAAAAALCLPAPARRDHRPGDVRVVRVEMGRPGLLTVSIAPGEAGIRVSGTAAPI